MANWMPPPVATIMVVEDQAIIRDLMVLILETSGYRVLEAETGAEALSVSERHPEPIHLLLTDVTMPRMTGVELAQHLQLLRPQMKVLYVSGYAAHSIEPGVSFLSKPFRDEALVEKVREVLRTS